MNAQLELPQESMQAPSYDPEPKPAPAHARPRFLIG